MGYPAFQCIKTKSTRQVYCSSDQVKNHATGARWVSACLAHYNIPASDIMKPYLSNIIPTDAIIYPED